MSGKNALQTQKSSYENSRDTGHKLIKMACVESWIIEFNPIYSSTILKFTILRMVALHFASSDLA